MSKILIISLHSDFNTQTTMFYYLHLSNRELTFTHGRHIVILHYTKILCQQIFIFPQSLFTSGP